ncbi:hypothetical protein [Sphingomonas sp. 3-13AW]|uniref:hypothetical protein n=1 Tax=Sphingomonas sp. 3-13AW TaxID=3050450 RepID=UPI003BB549E6
MSQNLHLYSLQGRCLSSIVLPGRTLHSSVPVTLPTRIQAVLTCAGFHLKQWLEVEQAGLASAYGSEFIVRVKSAAVASHMRPAGAVQIVEQIRRAGVAVAPITDIVSEAAEVPPDHPDQVPVAISQSA